ncbi:MAG: group 1 truncated hemoglobin [Cycloclasticus sp.]
MSVIDKTLFKRIGGLETLQKVHRIFYDKAYSHEWLKLYFTDKPQTLLEDQQTDFMAQLIGGPKRYAGKTPRMAHQHIHITEDLFTLRQRLLKESLEEFGLAEHLLKEWLMADTALKRAITKDSVEQCTQAYPNQEILSFPKPKDINL